MAVQNKKTKYHEDKYVQDLEALLEKSIEPHTSHGTFPRWTVKERTQLELEEDVYFDDQQIWLYHMGLRVLKPAEIDTSLAEQNEDEHSVHFFVPYSDDPLNQVKFQQHPQIETFVHVTYCRKVANNINEFWAIRQILEDIEKRADQTTPWFSFTHDDSCCDSNQCEVYLTIEFHVGFDLCSSGSKMLKDVEKIISYIPR